MGLEERRCGQIDDVGRATYEENCHLAFRRSDPNAATPIFENTRTNKLRRSDKRNDEAVAVSAHLLVDLTADEGPNPTYKAVLEEVPGLGRTYVQGILAEVLRENKYNFKNRRGQDKETYTVIDLNGVKSQTIHGALETSASVPYVMLVRPGNIEGLDSGLTGFLYHRDREFIA
jgi:hypothetical protein